jgi:hypothetical protein
VRDRREVRVPLLVLLVAALAFVAACAGVPSSGPVHEGRPVPQAPGLDEPDIRVLPPAPRPGDTPEETVRGFLVASANFEDRHAIARRYLTPALRDRWDSEAAVAIYDPAGLTLSVADATVTATAPAVGTISRVGAYAAAPRGGRLRDIFRLARVEGQWRIAALPAGLRLTRVDVQRAYRAVTVYFLDPTRQVLVPDARFLPVRLSGLSTALVRAVLAGPTPWLAPAVRTAVPPGTELLMTAPVHNGIVTVDLSREMAVAPDLPALAAQLVWTLGQLPEVRGTRLLAEGAPLPVPGTGRVQSRSEWASFDPVALPSRAGGYYVRRGRLVDRAGTPAPGPAGSGRLRLDVPAVAPGRDLVAGLRSAPTGVTLYAGSLAAGPRPRRSAAAFTPPSWDRGGNLWTVQAGRLVVLAGGDRPVPAVAPELERADVRALRVSRDGTRVAVVLVRDGTSTLLVGRVVVASGRLRAEAFRPAAPTLVDVRDVAWADANRLAVLARAGREAPAPWLVEADGSQLTPVATRGLAFSRLAAAPGRPLLAAAGEQIWEHAGSRWRVVGPGSDPLYPG